MEIQIIIQGQEKEMDKEGGMGGKGKRTINM